MYRTITLSNGARLLTEYIPGARSAALGFFVGAGSRHERATENGAAHFIEHLSFKGTDRRSAADLAREIDAIGGQVNAYTTKESTCYYARCLDRHLDRASDLLCDMLFHSRFAQEDVELERSVILEEIGMYEDAPEDLCADRLSMAVYKGRPLGRPILGRSSTLNEMTGESLRQWQAEHYCPGSIVVALAGRFEERHITALRERLAALPASTPRRMRDAVYHPAVTVRRKAIEQNHLILAYPGLSYRDDQRYALLLLNSILGEAAPPASSRSCGRSGGCAIPYIPMWPTMRTPVCWVSIPPPAANRRLRPWMPCGTSSATWLSMVPPRRSWTVPGNRLRPAF